MLPNDPVMLMCVINTKLRDFYPSLDRLCEDMELDINEIKNKLAAAGFTYDEQQNKFR